MRRDERGHAGSTQLDKLATVQGISTSGQTTATCILFTLHDTTASWKTEPMAHFKTGSCRCMAPQDRSEALWKGMMGPDVDRLEPLCRVFEMCDTDDSKRVF
jgi:hypothetical protein